MRKSANVDKNGKARNSVPEKSSKDSDDKSSPVRDTKQAVQEGSDDFFIAGIGASAGGLEAYEKFFSHMPPDKNIAFVLVSHLAPDHKSLMGELLAKHTKMPIQEVVDGMNIEPRHIYTIPPGKDMAIFHRTLRLMEPSAPHGFRHPIDSFFRSLAKDVKDKAIGIVLSGTGTEGTQGIRDIKNEGGLVIVQTPESAKYDYMPRSAIGTGLVDSILPPEEMPGLLSQYISKSGILINKNPDKALKFSTSSLQRIFTLLRDRKGHDFSLYKHNTLIRRIERRMSIHQISEVNSYIKYLQSDTRETDKLFKEFLIGVTSFFREPEAFEFIKANILPDLFREKSNNDLVRIWVPGCSTGEEAYSLAIIIKEYLSEIRKTTRVQIFATDLDDKAIETARTGIFPGSIDADVPLERLKRFFIKMDSTYKIREEIRLMLVFAVQNIINEPPFAHLDMISCRNLLIYLGSELQKHLIRLFHYALNPEGILFLGTSESIGGFFDLFSVIDKKWKLYRQKPRIGTTYIQHSYFTRKTKEDTSKINEIIKNENLINHNIEQKIQKLLLAEHTPTCVVIDENGVIQYIHGKAGKYLEPASGKASLVIFDMAKQDIKRELNYAIRKTLSHKKDSYMEKLPVHVNGTVQYINLRVKTLPASDFNGLILIVFEEVVCRDNDMPLPAGHAAIGQEEYIQRIEEELKYTREDLQSTIQELENTNEELKSANEELQSTNEELQSTNEELETSKEELQSVNEELVTVNAELQGKIDEMVEISNDLNNLLVSTEIATIFLDSNLNIRRYTPAVTRIIKLLYTDIGRPLADFSSRLINDQLMEDAWSVLDTLEDRIKEVRHKDGRWYLMRILPYRTTQNRIDGIVITFTDITVIKNLEKEVRESESRYHILFRSSFDAIALIEKESGKIIECNPEFERRADRNAEQLQMMKIWELAPPDKIDRTKDEFYSDVFDKAYNNKEFEFQRSDGTTIKSYYRTIQLPGTSYYYLQSYAGIKPDRSTAGEKGKTVEALAERIFQTLPEPLLALDNQLVVLKANRSFYQTFAATPETTIGRMIFDLHNGQWNRKDLKYFLEDLVYNNVQVQKFRITIQVPGTGAREFLLDARQLMGPGNQAEGILLSLESQR